MPLPWEYRKTTFLILGSTSLGIVALVLICYNYMLMKSHVTPIFWAIVWYLILKAFRRPLVHYLELISSYIPFRVKAVFWLCITVAFLYYLDFIMSVWSELDNLQIFWHLLTFCTLLMIVVVPLVVDFEHLAMILILGTLIFFTMFLGVFVLKKCYDESMLVSNKFSGFVEIHKSKFLISNSSSFDIWNSGTKMCHFFVGFVTRNHYLKHFVKLRSEVEYCDENIQYLKTNIEEISMMLAQWLAGHVGIIGFTMTNFFKSTFDFLSSVGDFFFALFLFVSLLYYFVKYENEIENQLSDLSPLTELESAKMMQRLNERVVMTFYYAALLSMVRFMVTLFSFWFVSFEILWIFAFLSGFLAIVPVLSSWLIWIPTTCFLMVRDGVTSYQWIFMLCMNIVPSLIDTYVLLPYFEDQYPEILGLSIILGIYSFGWSGVLVGPLVFASSIGMIELYKNYMKLDAKKKKSVPGLRNSAHGTPSTPNIEEITSRAGDSVRVLKME
jgi:predicted PurR-regulated permease PerM